MERLELSKQMLEMRGHLSFMRVPNNVSFAVKTLRNFQIDPTKASAVEGLDPTLKNNGTECDC